jgi:hypothetical protein
MYVTAATANSVESNHAALSSVLRLPSFAFWSLPVRPSVRPLPPPPPPQQKKHKKPVKQQ